MKKKILLGFVLGLLLIGNCFARYLPYKFEVIVNTVRSCKLVYMPESEGEDYWQTIEETEKRGGGDCEDLSLYMIYKFRELGYECWLVFGDNLCGQNHCWIRIKFWYCLIDVDMQTRTVRNAFQEIKPSQHEFNKMTDWQERQSREEEK